MSCTICEESDNIYIQCKNIKFCYLCVKKYLQKLIDDKYVTAIRCNQCYTQFCVYCMKISNDSDNNHNHVETCSFNIYSRYDYYPNRIMNIHAPRITYLLLKLFREKNIKKIPDVAKPHVMSHQLLINGNLKNYVADRYQQYYKKNHNYIANEKAKQRCHEYEQWKKKNAKKFQRREKRKSKKKDQSQLINDFLKEISS